MIVINSSKIEAENKIKIIVIDDCSINLLALSGVLKRLVLNIET